MSTTTEVTSRGARLIERWIASNKRAEKAQRELVDATQDLDTARIELANWLMPKDAKMEEKFCVAYGANFVEAFKTQMSAKGFHIRMRPQPKEEVKG